MQTYLDTVEDLKWLAEVTAPEAANGYVRAILYGHESSPNKIELFARDHYQCPPLVLEVQDDGKYKITQQGEAPKYPNLEAAEAAGEFKKTETD